jgi:hypothetical protein
MGLLLQCKWLNEPTKWELVEDELAVVTDLATDFWRETHYGFTRHSGHLFGYQTSGDFTATLRVRARFEALYDQAGLMVHLDEENWVKAGVEFSDGEATLSSVLTVGQSDWATGRFGGDGRFLDQGDCRKRNPEASSVCRWKALAFASAEPVSPANELSCRSDVLHAGKIGTGSKIF